MALAGESLDGLAEARSTRLSSRARSPTREIAIALGRGKAQARLLLRPRSRVHPRQRRVPHVTGTANVETLLEALPYIRQFHGRTVVIKYGGAAMQEPARRVRHRRRPAQVRRAQPRHRPRRRSRHHPLHGAARPRGALRRGHARLRRRDRGDREDGPARQGQRRHRRLAQPPRPAGGRPLGRGRALFGIAPHRRPTRSASSARSSGSTWTCSTIAADYIPVIASAGDRSGGPLLQRQRRYRGRAGRGGPRRPQGDLPHRRARLARRPRRRGIAALSGDGQGDRYGARLGRGGMRPKLEACAAAIRGGAGSAHIIDGRRARATARAVHGRGNRDDGDPVSAAARCRGERRNSGAGAALRDADLCAGAGRVRAWRARGSGTPRGASTSTSSPGSVQPRPLPPADRRRDRGAGGTLADLQPLLLRAGDAALRAARGVEPRRPRLSRQHRHRGEWCAIKRVRKRAHERGIAEPEIVSLDGAFHGRTLAALAATPSSPGGSVRPAAPRLRLGTEIPRRCGR